MREKEEFVVETRELHPEYGPCDEKGPDGFCSECFRRYSKPAEDSPAPQWRSIFRGGRTRL